MNSHNKVVLKNILSSTETGDGNSFLVPFTIGIGAVIGLYHFMKKYSFSGKEFCC